VRGVLPACGCIALPIGLPLMLLLIPTPPFPMPAFLALFSPSRPSQVARIYDLKGSQRDRYAADDPTAAGEPPCAACPCLVLLPAHAHTRATQQQECAYPSKREFAVCRCAAVACKLASLIGPAFWFTCRYYLFSAGAVLLDENLQELNLTSPTLVGPRAYARLQRALWSGAITPHSACSPSSGWGGARRVCNNRLCIAGVRMHLLCCKLVLVLCDLRTSSAVNLAMQTRASLLAWESWTTRC